MAPHFQIDLDHIFDEIVIIMEKIASYGVEYIPYANKMLMDVWNSLYSPKQILHNVLVVSAIQAVVVLFQSFSGVFHTLQMELTSKGRLEKKLLKELSGASSYVEWQTVATKLDKLRGLDVWRTIEKSSLYDSETLSKRIAGTIDMLDKGDMFNLMFRLRGGLARDQFGIQHSGLFSRALAGTKRIVERYHEAMASALNFICDMPDDEVPTDAKLAFFNETRHSYGRTALLLSGGGYLGYYHMGVVKALWTQVMLPRVISGSSAGSIMTAIVGTRTDEQLCDLVTLQRVPDDIRMDFLNHSQELRHPTAKYLQSFVPERFRWLSSVLLCMLYDDKLFNLDTPRFLAALQQDIGHETFQEAFDRTGRIISITVAPLNNYDPPRLLNYITAPHVCVWSAAAASSAIPGMFDSITLIVKEPDGQFRPENEWTRQGLVGVDAAKAAKMASYTDGSVESDLPMQQLSELFNVNHFIVSQVNPHSAMLTSMSLQATIWSNPFYRAVVGYARFLKDQTKDWFKNILNLLVFRSNAPVWSARRGLIQTLTQEYEGRECDITIMPWTGHISPYTALLSTIKNPTEKEYLELLSVAEKNTWPFIPRIRAHCLVEKTLDKCVQRLRRLVTDETESEYLTAGAQVEAGLHSPLRTKDRTPSFYTSRSIVNLSGLSVADPVPLSHLKRGPSSGVIGSEVDGLAPKHLVEPAKRASRLSNAWSLGRSADECELVPDQTAQDVSTSNQLEEVGDYDDTAADFWNVNVKVQSQPLNAPAAPSNMTKVRRGSFALQSTDDLLKHMSSFENLHAQGHAAADEAKGGQLKRRPSMANFYYKHCASASTDNLNCKPVA